MSQEGGGSMSINDLLAVLHEILPDDKVTRQDITAPTPRIKQIYFNFLQEFYFSETLLQPATEFLRSDRLAQYFQHQELFQETMPVDILMSALRFFFFQVKHNEPISFGLMDLIEPDPKRTRRFLAAMCNFWTFCNSNYEPTARIQEEIAERDREIAKLGDQVKNATRKIEELRKRNGEDMIKAQAHEAEEKEAHRELKNLSQVAEDFNREGEELKTTLKTSKAREADLCLKVEKSEERQKSLNINLNGEDAKTELQSELNTLRETLTAKTQTGLEKKKQVEDFEERRKELEALLEQIQTAVAKDQEIKSTKNDAKSLEREKVLENEEKEDLNSQIRTNSQRFKDLKAQHNSAMMKWKKKREIKQAELKSYSKELESKKQDMSEDDRLASDLQSSMERVREQIRSLDEEMRQEQTLIKNEYGKILEGIKETSRYHNKEMDIIEKAFKRM